jgi:hypothetical protein
MKFATVAVLAGMTFAPFAGAQKLELKFEALAAKASEKAEVDLDGSILRLVLPQVLSQKEKVGKTPVLDLLNGVQEVHLRNYEFPSAGAYSDKDLEPLRKQVSEGSGWSRIMNVKEKEDSVEVFVQLAGDKVTSCLVLAAERRELSVVYLMGTVTLAQTKELVESNVVHNLAALGQMASK